MWNFSVSLQGCDCSHIYIRCGTVSGLFPQIAFSIQNTDIFCD